MMFITIFLLIRVAVSGVPETHTHSLHYISIRALFLSHAMQKKNDLINTLKEAQVLAHQVTRIQIVRFFKISFVTSHFSQMNNINFK